MASPPVFNPSLPFVIGSWLEYVSCSFVDALRPYRLWGPGTSTYPIPGIEEQQQQKKTVSPTVWVVDLNDVRMVSRFERDVQVLARVLPALSVYRPPSLAKGGTGFCCIRVSDRCGCNSHFVRPFSSMKPKKPKKKKRGWRIIPIRFLYAYYQYRIQGCHD